MNWRKSTRCAGNGACIEVADTGRILVRDSTDPDGPRIALDRAAFRHLIAAIKETRR
jgi:hypothetical protein